LGVAEGQCSSRIGHFVVGGYLLGYYRNRTPAPCVTVEEIEDVSVGSLGVAQPPQSLNPTPGSLVLARQQSASGGAAAAKAIGDGLLRHAGATPTPGTLLPGLTSP